MDAGLQRLVVQSDGQARRRGSAERSSLNADRAQTQKGSTQVVEEGMGYAGGIWDM